MDECPQPCDYCKPDEWHDCVRPRGHLGPHSCRLEPEDLAELGGAAAYDQPMFDIEGEVTS